MVNDLRIAMLFLVGFSIAGAFFIAVTDDVMGDAPVGDVTGNELVTDGDEVAINIWHASVSGVRQTNGTLWHFGVKVITFLSDHEIWASYSSDNGTSWISYVIMDNTLPDFQPGVGTPYMVTDAVTLSNNSIIVSLVLYAYDTAIKYESWIFCHWNNSDLDQWEMKKMYSHASHSVDKDVTMAVNGTDIVLVAYEVDTLNNVYYDFFNPATRTIDGNVKNNFEPQANFGPIALCNSTGVFFLAIVLDSDDDLDIWTTDGLWTNVHTQAFGSNYWPYDIVITGDDTFVFIATLNNGGYHHLFYWNETNSGDRWLIDNPTGDTSITYPKIMLYNDTDTYIIIMGYSLTDDCFKYAGGDYFIDSVVWETRWSTSVWDETDDTIKDYVTYLPHDLFPISIDPITSVLNRTMLPNTGWFGLITDYTVAGDLEDLHEIHADTTTWPGSPYYHYNPVEEEDEEEEDPEDEGFDPSVAWALWWGDTACISTIMIMAVIALVAFLIIRSRM